MPVPEGALPAAAAILFPVTNTGISTRAALDQSTAEAELKQRYVRDNPGVQNPLDDVFAGLRRGASLVHNTLEQAARGLLDDLEGTWETIEDVVEALTAIPHKITEHTESITRLDEVTAAMNTTQAYVGDLQDMVTAPRVSLQGWAVLGNGAVSITQGFTIIGGATIMPAMPVFGPRVYPFSTTGDIYYTPIVVDRKGSPGKIRWIAGADTSIFSIDYYEMALCAYNPTNGNIEKVWGSGNIKDGVASTSTLAEVEIDMALTGQHVTPGQILFVAHQQVAPGLLQSARSFAGVPQGNIARPSTTLLKAACFVAPNYSTGIPSSIALSTLMVENRFIPWSAITVSADTA